MSTYDRSVKVQQLRLAGARAAEEGKSIESCPHRYMNAYQWRNGYLGLWGSSHDIQAKIKEREAHAK